MKKKPSFKEFRVRVIKNYRGSLMAGASVMVRSETKTRYKGLHPCGAATFTVSVPKKYCVREGEI